MAPRGNEPAYWITVECKSQGILIVADMPEHWGYHVSSSFDSPRGNSADVAGYAGLSKPTNLGKEFVGGDVVFKALTKRVWTGTSPISLDLELMFDAETNTKRDVHDTLTLLTSLALPGTGYTSGLTGDILVPPNPTRLNSTLNQISIKIGNQYFWPDVTIDSATPGVDMRLNPDATNLGWPIAGSIRLAATTETVYSKADLFKVAGVAGFTNVNNPLQAALSPSPVKVSPAQAAALRNANGG